MTDRIKVTVTEVQPIQVTIRNQVVIPGAGAAWGGISGTLSAQTDLQTELDGKLDHTGGILSAYTETADSITFTAGAASLNLLTAENIETTTLTEDSTLTITNLTAYKALTIAVTQTAGPWTLDLAYGAKTISVTLNGAAGEALETVEVWCDGTDLFVPIDGGVLWAVGV